VLASAHPGYSQEDEMKSSFPTHSAVIIAVLATAAAGLGGHSSGLQAADKAMEEVMVQAPIEIERQKVSDASSPTSSVEIIELRRMVDITDLDLATHADVEELERRIEAVAKDSCEKLSKMFPPDGSDAKEIGRCTKRAIAGSMAQKEEAIAAAR
jgi:UrcA family protein